MAMISPLGKKEEIYGYQTLYRELGYYISRLEQYERALPFFDEAIAKTPEDKRALLGRAWARSKFCHYDGALEDLERALVIKPDDLVTLAQKSLNYYLNCEFEEGLVQNHRLIPIRKKPENFVVGAMHCAEAIENCLGERTGRPLRDHFLIIRKLAWRKNVEDQKPYEPKSKRKKKKKKKPETVEPIALKLMSLSRTVIESAPSEELHIENYEDVEAAPEQQDLISLRSTVYTMQSELNVTPPKIAFPYKPLQRYTSNIENFMAEKYLDTVYKDKIFLKEIDIVPGVIGPNKKGTQKILDLAKKSYKYVNYKQELLRTRRPFYFIKYQEATSSEALRARQERELLQQQQITKVEADNIVNKLTNAVENRNLRRILDLADKLKIYCDSKPKKILPSREYYLAIIYESVCQGFYDVMRVNPGQYAFEQEARIEVMLGLELSRAPSEDSVVKEFKDFFVDWKKKITIYGLRLKKATTPDELVYLFYELSRFHCEMKQFELSRVYARKCINDARRINKLKWVVNAMFMLTKINMLQRNKNEAEKMAAQARKVAVVLDDDDMVEFMEKTVDVIKNVEFESVHGVKVLEKREQKIVQMMGGKMRDEAAHLFRTMQAMPAARRMSVMPGIKMDELIAEEKASAINRKQSIMPSKRESEPEVKERKKGENMKGIGFLQEIKYHV